MTAIDRASCHIRSGLAAAPATSSALPRASGRPTPAQLAPNRQSRNGKAATRRAGVSPRHGLLAETAAVPPASSSYSYRFLALASSARGERSIHHFLCLAYDCIKVRLVPEAFGVDLVDRFGAGRPGCKPAAGRDHLETVDRSVVPGGAVELCYNRLTDQIRLFDGLGRQFFKLRFLLGCRRRVDPCVQWRAELGC